MTPGDMHTPLMSLVYHTPSYSSNQHNLAARRVKPQASSATWFPLFDTSSNTVWSNWDFTGVKPAPELQDHLPISRFLYLQPVSLFGCFLSCVCTLLRFLSCCVLSSLGHHSFIWRYCY